MAAMVGDDSFWDLDPWHLAKFGWVRPRFIAIGATGSQGGGVELMQATGHDETGGAAARPIVFYDPSRGLNEYFIAQYRSQFPKCPGSGFLGDLCTSYRDNGVADTGIALWHVMTNADGCCATFVRWMTGAIASLGLLALLMMATCSVSALSILPMVSWGALATSSRRDSSLCAGGTAQTAVYAFGQGSYRQRARLR